MDIKFCKTCGGPLTQCDEYSWECGYCHNVYSDNSVKKESENLLRTLMSEQKVEQVANLRRNLYDAISEKYTDSEEIVRICNNIRTLLPDDFMANFYYTANHGTPREVVEAVRAIDSEAELGSIEGIVMHLVKSMRSEYALPLQNLVERSFKNTNMLKFENLSTAISDEMVKVNAGIYETAVPRDVFVAYSSKDMAKVEELVEYLESNGLDCFVAARNLRHGRGAKQNYEKALHEAMTNCRSIVFVSSRNSRSMECDALKVELKYIKNADILNAPLEYRRNYTSMPAKYKMHRVEYRLDNDRTQPYAEKVLAEFFGGLEYAYSPEEIVDRIYSFDDEIIDTPAPATKQVIAPTPKAVKYCAVCGAENIIAAKFCGECGKGDFVNTLEEYKLRAELDAIRKKIAETNKRADSTTDTFTMVRKPSSTPAKKTYSDGITDKNTLYNYARNYHYGYNGYTIDYYKAFEYCERAAELGHVDAQNLLGYCYETGKGTAKDLDKCFIWYKKASEGGSSVATGNLGLCYEYSRGVAKDLYMAFSYYKKSADMGYSQGMVNTGSCYEFEKGVPKNLSEAFSWYKKAAEKGNAEGQKKVGICYEYGKGVTKDIYQAYAWYKKAAEKGNHDAENRLAVCYEDGLGVSKDIYEAVKWYRKSAEGGYNYAQNNLGNCYEYGKGVTKDIYEAFKWYRKAADQGLASGQYNVGRCYEYGYGTAKDPRESFNWYKKAAENGNKYAQNSVALCYELEKGVSKDLYQAYVWYKKSADQGYNIAENNLGLCYEYGKGIAKDLYQAFAWYKKSADHNNTYAMNNLALCYEYGKGTAKDVYEAFRWYKKSAEGGYAIAQKNLGICYMYATGTAQDKYKAFEWYLKAANQGNSDAQNRVAVCYEKGDGTYQNYAEALRWYQASANQGYNYAQRNLGLCYEYGRGTSVNYYTALSWYEKARANGYKDIENDIERCRKKMYS